MLAEKFILLLETMVKSNDMPIQTAARVGSRGIATS